MAHVLELTDGTTTINLTSGATTTAWATSTGYTAGNHVANDNAYYVCTANHTSGATTEPGTGANWLSYWALVAAFTPMYAPNTPDLSMQESQVSSISDGGEIPLTTRRNVTETAELVIVAGTKAIMQANVQAIEQMLLNAERRQRWGTGSRVYIQAQFDGESGKWRSEILAGRVEVTSDSMQLWSNSRIPARLHITRRHYWESTTLSELSISTATNTTPATGGVTVYVDHDSSGKDNYIQIADTQVTGSIPGPAMILLQNTSGGSVAFTWWHLSNNAFDSPTTFDPFLMGTEAEEQTAESDGGQKITWASGGIDHSTAAFAWGLGATRLGVMAGQYWRALATFAAYPAGGMYIRPSLQYKVGSAFYSLWHGEEILMDSLKVQDLGAIPMPADTGNSQLYFVLTLRASGSGTATVDFVQLQPNYEYRRLYQNGFSMADDAAVVDDGIEGVTYYLGGSDHWPIYVAYNKPIHLYPGVTQRIRVLNDATSWTAARTLKAQVWYRPRRLTV